jgi:dienelactone hydrolase
VHRPGRERLSQPLSFLAYGAANCSNVVASLPQVDPTRIGIIGHSFGGKWAMFASCLHELHALMALRPFLISDGAQDRPDHWVALNHSSRLNQFLGHTNRVSMTMRDGHSPTPASNAQAFAFLEHFLEP